jgi:hypothetical protein
MPLFELPETEQEVFDIIKSHLLRQKQKSVDKATCKYRHGDLRCAAGVLIPDECYDISFENLVWAALVKEKDFPQQHYDLISSLQQLHDKCDPVEWEEQLRAVASYFKLKYERTTNV